MKTQEWRLRLTRDPSNEHHVDLFYKTREMADEAARILVKHIPGARTAVTPVVRREP